MWTWLSYKGKKKSFEENLWIKVVFDGFNHTLQNLVKTYDGISNEVIYDNVNKIFKVWVTEEETFGFDKQVKMDARILFKGAVDYKPICGTYTETNYWYDSLKKEKLDV